ncbi:uncharacterized protein [Dermacentor andersoni]|uniref:uncharacterized protein n=1 Tax=Dermacentor andersoni TaxID=34620 RepID=UPI0024177B3C|nr:uncharacterized protein LOC129383829 [Dermacentor andersoni]
MPRPVDKDLASLTVVQPPQITAAEDSREELPVEGKKKRQPRRKSHSRKRSTAEVPSQESAAVTADQSPRREVTVEARGREEEHEVGAVASAAEHTEQISIGAAPTAVISLPLNASRPVSNAHETVPQRLSTTAKQSMVPTWHPSYTTSAAPGAEIQPPSVSSSNASTEQEKQRQGSVSDGSRLAPKVSARKVSVESRMIRGSRSTTEGLKSQSPATPRFSSLAKKDGATSTTRWPEEDSEMGSSSGSSTGDKYTQTGDVIVYPRRSPFDSRRPEVTKFVSPDESLSDILYDRGVTSPSPTTASWSSSYPARSREASMSEGPATTSRFIRKKAAGKERDSDSIRDMSGSESIISFKQPAVKQEKSDIPALPEKKPMQKCPAPRRDTDVVDMVKDSLMENATARSGEGCHYVERQIGSITSPKVALNIRKPTCHEVGANVQAGVEVGEVEEFYEEVAEEVLNDSRRLSTGSSSRERLNISKLAAVSDEHAEKDGQQGTDVLKGNKKNCKKYFRRERQGDLVSFTGQVNASDATNKTLPTSVTGEEPNSRNTLPDMVSHTETSNEHSRRKEEHGKLDEGSSTSRMTSGQHGETPANTVVPPSSQSACVQCTRKSSKNVGEALEIPGNCGKNRNAETSASKSAPHEFRFEQQADTLLEVQPYSVAKRPFGCICDGFQGYSPSEFLYSPPSSPFQFGEAAISSPKWSNTPIPGTTQVFAGPWPLLDPQSTTSRPNTESRRDNQGTQIPRAAWFRNLNFQAVMKDRAMPLAGYENVCIRAEKAVANESRSKDSRSKGTLNDFATGTTRHGAQRDATSRRSISRDPKQHLLIETDDFTERTPQASRKDSTASVASGRLQISRKASTASIDAGISQALRKDSTASIQMGIPYASRKPSTASVDFARLQTGSKSSTRKTTSTEQETPCSTSRLRCGQSSPARRCQSRKCHHGGRHSCGGHSHCRTAKGLDNPPSAPEEPMTTVDGNDAALVRLEQLLREENRLLRQEKQRREGQLRLRSLLEERDQLLSALRGPTEDGQEAQNALRDQANAVSKALAALDLTSGSPACRPYSQRGAKGVGPIRDDNLQDKTACSARNKSGAPTQAGTSSDSSPGKAAQRLQGSSRNSKRGKP